MINGTWAAEQRLIKIRSVLEEHGKVRVDEVAKELNVSEMTIRRDLQELEAIGVARRIRGGAVAVGPVAFADRHRRQLRAKSVIADKLLPLVPDTGAVGFDASSTLARLAGTLQTARDLVVVTNGPDTFSALHGTPGVSPLLTGGALDERTGSLVGPFAVRAAGELLLSRFFLSAAGIDAELGASETCMEEAEVKRSLAAMAGEVVLAVDSSKLSTRSVALGVRWEQVTVLVTELDPGDERLDPYRGLTEVR